MPRTSIDMDLAEIEGRYMHALARSMELADGALNVAHTRVSADADRAGSPYAVAYRVGAATIVRAGPEHVDALSGLHSDDTARSLDDVVAWGTASGWQFFDGNDTHIASRATLHAVALPDGARLVSLDRDRPDDVSRIADLVGACDPDDVEEAEIELDDLDPLMCALVRSDGRVEAFASGRRWDADEQFDDIGVLVRDERRGQGWGKAVVSEFCRASFDLDRLPLYRCNWTRRASKALALGLGFKQVAQLVAISPPAQPSSER